MVHPDPPRRDDAASRASCAATASRPVRAVPPRTDRDQGVTDEHRVAVGQDADAGPRPSHSGRPFAVRVLTGEIVVAGADDEPCAACSSSKYCSITTV